MHKILTTIALAVALSFGVGAPVGAKTLRFAFQGDAGSMDPYFLNETFTLSFLGNIYEGLTRRGPDLTIKPALAERWEIVEPTRWRFHLRRGVKFHDGDAFDADDVLFSAERAEKEGSDLKARLTGVVDVIKVDDYTVDFVTEAPNPILINEWDTWYIMSKQWAEANNATNPGDVRTGEENYAATHANGTGPFVLESREVDVKTVATANPDWWDTLQDNHPTRVVFTPIATDATRVAALLTGEIDMMYPVPVQNVDRVSTNTGTSALVGPELRTIFLGFDQLSDELKYSDVKGANPFKDVRVREAFNLAIDRAAIKEVVMRDASTPTGEMVAPGVHGANPKAFPTVDHDPDRARALLTEAGFADGFRVTLDCPNDRYVNDAQICEAAASMLGKIGVTVDVNAQPKAKYFPQVLAYDTSFFMLGWTPGSFDSWNPIHNLHGCRDESGRGQFNLGGYCNAAVDTLAAKILSETDQAKRDAMVAEAWTTIYSEFAHAPLHQQALAWGVRDGVTLTQRPDNQFEWRHVAIAD